MFDRSIVQPNPITVRTNSETTASAVACRFMERASSNGVLQDNVRGATTNIRAVSGANFANGNHLQIPLDRACDPDANSATHFAARSARSVCGIIFIHLFCQRTTMRCGLTAACCRRVSEVALQC